MATKKTIKKAVLTRPAAKAVKKAAVKKTPTKKAATPVRKATTLKAKPGSIAQIRHYDFKVSEPTRFQLSKLKPDVFQKLSTSPKGIEITLEPKVGEDLVYHLTPGFTSQQSPMAQFSVRAVIYNKGTETYDLDKVIIEYKIGAQTVKKEIFLPSDQLIIDPGYAWAWQNSRPYHENGDIVFWETPFPDKATMKFYFKGYSGPVSTTKNLKPYTGALSLPFKSKDFETDEYLSSYSMHGGGDQVFAYDIGVQAYKDKKWTGVHPGKDGSENAHSRIWGKPVYAMEDGIVLHFENNIPNNWKPDGSDAGMKKQKDELWGSFDYGGSGNHFYIRHGNVVALYAHLQKGSLTSKLMKVGATVKKGDLLGKAGNSGNSSGPHLHIHIKTYKNDAEPEGGIFRPLLFNNGFVIGQEEYTKPKSNVNWSELVRHGIPGLKSKASFIHPSDTHPYCAYPTNWGEVCRFGVSESSYQDEFDKVWTCGYYPIWVDGYDVGGKTYFNVIFRPSKGVQWVARHGMDGAGYQAEFNKWDKAGYRLINVNSYLSKGKVRYAAVWIKDNSVATMAYHGRPLAWHESNFQKHWKAGWVPTNVSCVYTGGQTYVTALWEKKNTGGFYLRPEMTLQEFVDAFKQYTDKEKFKLVYLDAYVKNGKPRLSGIWYKNQPNYNSWWEKYNLTAAKFQAEYNAMLKNGYLTRCIAGYSQGGVARFEGIWSK